MACAAAGPPADDLLTPGSAPVEPEADPADPAEPPPREDAEAAPLPPAPAPPTPPSRPPEEDAGPSPPARPPASPDPREPPVTEAAAAPRDEDAAPTSSASGPQSPSSPEPSSSLPTVNVEIAPFVTVSDKTNEKCEETLIIDNCEEPTVQVTLDERSDQPIESEKDAEAQKESVKNGEDTIQETCARKEAQPEEKAEFIMIDKPEQNDDSSINLNEFTPSCDENLCLKDEGCLSGESENESNHVVPDEGKNKHNAVKRGISDNKTDHCPSKKLCQELQDTFPKHDILLSEYLSNISCSNEEEINKHTENLVAEIEMLRELANSKEVEWNQLIHLRKVKEEILLRLLRKRNIISAEKVLNSTDLNKDLLNKQIFELNKTCVEDKNDEVRRLKNKNVSSVSGNAVQLNSSGLMMVPVSSSVYCQSNMNNSNFDGHLNPHIYNNKPNILPKPVMIPNHRLPGFHIPELNGQSNRYNSQKGRQGAVKDVQSIIADHRQRYPDTVPRRGRRMKSVLNPQISSNRLPMPHSDHNAADLGLLFGNLDNTQHLSPVDGMSLQQNAVLNQAGGLPNGMSFKDVLVRFANITGQQANCMNTKLHPPPPYPDVTLHPVGGNASGSPFPTKISQQQQQQQTNSLLHGILTKSQPRQENRFSTFSPTLAQLLTAPEKNTPGNVGRSVNSISTTNNYVQQKTSSEITITAVQPTTSNNTMNQNQTEILQLDEFDETEPEEDSADRPLVIDEGGRDNSTNNKELANSSLELNENEVPECQGCRKREAQFVCAGCANQWYCSRECQVSAWDEHSEVCTG